MTDRRDDWPDGILERDLDAIAGPDPSRPRGAERIARDMRNMNAVLSAMADRVGEGLPVPIRGSAARAAGRPSRRWTAGPLAAAAAVAALVLVRGTGIEEDAGPVASPAPSMVSEMNVEADGPFAVFPTRDPDIAVVWLFDPKESD